MIFCFVFFFKTDILRSEIGKRVLNDGTVEYFNTDEIPQPVKKQKFNSRYDGLIESIAKQNGIDPYLVKCIIKVESGFKADAVSVAGAMGLMQIMQEIVRYYDVKDPFDPEENLSAGIRHLKFLMDFFKNDIVLSIAAYHAGLGRVKEKMKIPPVQSTVDYVDNVMLLYTGKKNNNGDKVSALYKRINSEGVIEIYNN